MIDVDGHRERGCPDIMELAGYIEGRLGAAARQRIEPHLAECDRCLEAVTRTRTLRVEAAPPEVIERARSVAVDRGAPSTRRARLSRVVTWPLAAAASVAVCLVGFRVGAGAFAAGRSGDAFLAEMTFNVFGAADQEGIAQELLPAAPLEDAP